MPDGGAVRGIVRDLPLELRWLRFYAEQGEYECRFAVGGFTFACVLKHNPHTREWETEETALGRTRDERLSTAARAAAVLIARCWDEAHAENEWRDVQEYVRCRRYREAARYGAVIAGVAGENSETDGKGGEEPCN